MSTILVKGVAPRILRFLSECGTKYVSTGAIATRAGAKDILSLKSILVRMVKEGYLERLNLMALRHGIVVNTPCNGPRKNITSTDLTGSHPRITPSEFLKLLREQGVLFGDAGEIEHAKVAYRLSVIGQQYWSTNVESHVSDLLIHHTNGCKLT